MIAAKELRIGNWVSYESGEYQVLDITTEYSPAATLGRTGSGIDHHRLIDVHLINPIPISEEWLLKFRIRHGIFKIQDNDVWIEKVEDRFYLAIQDGMCGDNIRLDLPKSIHQLQNLFFALSGEELVIVKESV